MPIHGAKPRQGMQAPARSSAASDLALIKPSGAFASHSVLLICGDWVKGMASTSILCQLAIGRSVQPLTDWVQAQRVCVSWLTGTALPG